MSREKNFCPSLVHIEFLLADTENRRSLLVIHNEPRSLDIVNIVREIFTFPYFHAIKILK